jgi:hypothetical protein
MFASTCGVTPCLLKFMRRVEVTRTAHPAVSTSRQGACHLKMEGMQDQCQQYQKCQTQNTCLHPASIRSKFHAIVNGPAGD